MSSDGVERLGGDPPSPYEGKYGFSRVAVVHGFVIVGGTTSVNADGVVLGASPYDQTIEILRKVEHELGRVGASLGDVVQTRIYVTDISRSEEVGRAHGDIFGDDPPADDDGRRRGPCRPPDARRGRDGRGLRARLEVVLKRAPARSDSVRRSNATLLSLSNVTATCHREAVLPSTSEHLMLPLPHGRDLIGSGRFHTTRWSGSAILCARADDCAIACDQRQTVSNPADRS